MPTFLVKTVHPIDTRTECVRTFIVPDARDADAAKKRALAFAGEYIGIRVTDVGLLRDVKLFGVHKQPIPREQKSRA